MVLNIDIARLKAFLEQNPDCEMIAEGEYVADIYDCEKPLTLNLAFSKDACEVMAAAYLAYDEEQDGWYMTERTEDINEIEAALKSAMEADG